MTTTAPLLGEVAPVELMNTIHAGRDGVRDALATPEEALGWLRAVELPLVGVGTWLRTATPEALGDAFEQLRALRNALRRLAAETTGDERLPVDAERQDALATLNSAAAQAPARPVLRWAPGGDPIGELHAGADFPQAVVSLLAAQGVDLFAGELRHRLRACLAPGCVLYFVKQHPRREWCSASCGNRARVARHYQRHRGG